ncbi:MAG: nucleotidyltransferase domain-containing protein [Promethearchaeota archaeon]
MNEREFYSGIPPRVDEIKPVLAKIGRRYPRVISIYLFGSVARGEADWRSDIDLLFLVRDACGSAVLRTLLRDPDYIELEGEALRRLEGGLGPIIVDLEELLSAFDTLVDKILEEGILLYGRDLASIVVGVDRSKYESKENLLDLVNSL